MNPKVSIIIVNWNGEYLLKKCLDSALKQTYENYDVIVVDNASTDGSVEFIKNNYQSVRIIQNKVNYGYAKGNNIGIKSVQSDFIATLNTDTEVNLNWIRELVKVMYADSTIGICASKQLFYNDRKRIDSAGIKLTPYCAGKNIGLGEIDNNQYKSKKVFGANGASAFYRKKMLDEIGLFDEDYFLYEEELDLSWRAKLAGWKCMFVETAIVYHMRSETVNKSSYLCEYYSQRNRLFNIVKNPPIAAFFILFPFILKCEIDNWLNIIFTLNRNRLAGRIDFLKMFPVLIKKRHYIQKMKKISFFEFLRSITWSW